MLSSVNSKAQKELLVQFGIGTDLNTIDKKVTLKLDTKTDINATNFQKSRCRIAAIQYNSRE